MNYEVVWSSEAELAYSKVLTYLAKHWGRQSVEKFMERTDEVLLHLKRNPRIYIYSEHAKAYRAVITKHVSFLFQIKNNSVEIITIWDNRKRSK